ncbi:hypothetical protein SDC9_177250 [bioreactor metagenome]|uniref:Uncharacterized protein n=1 Tax=bioreactor metagenome TaxID=1076179 RepID=A0A645GSB1_9ZZZZ
MINLGFHEHLITEKIKYALKQGLTKQRLMDISTEASILSYKIIIECLDGEPVPQTYSIEKIDKEKDKLKAEYISQQPKRIVVKNGAILEDSILDEIIYEVDRIIVEWG